MTPQQMKLKFRQAEIRGINVSLEMVYLNGPLDHKRLQDTPFSCKRTYMLIVGLSDTIINLYIGFFLLFINKNTCLSKFHVSSMCF
jgi:hypothetical protein